MNDKALEPAIFISLSSAVEERPTEKGWYIGDGDDYDTVRWLRLASQDIIEDAFLTPGQKSVMVYGKESQQDVKIDFAKFYAKKRDGVNRRPVLRIGAVVSDAEHGSSEATGLGVWEYNYEREDCKQFTEWFRFDQSDCELFDLTLQTGREKCVIYDGNSAVRVTLTNGEKEEMGWVNILWSEGCGEIQKSKGQVRRREPGQESMEAEVKGGVPGVGSIVTAAVRATPGGAEGDEDFEKLDSLVKSLTEMGFQKDASTRALRNNSLNAESAVAELIGDFSANES